MTTGINWVSWCCLRAGNDGRRDSAKQWQRTKYAHAMDPFSTTTLCNRPVGALMDDRTTLQKCPTCLKRCNKGIST